MHKQYGQHENRDYDDYGDDGFAEDEDDTHSSANEGL